MKNYFTFITLDKHRGRIAMKFIIITLFSILSISCLLAQDSCWVQKSPMPTARYVTSSSVLDGKIYVIGGSNGPSIANVECYEAVTDTWTIKNNFPAPVGGGASSVVNGRIYFMGGGLLGSPAYDSVWVYNDTTDTWTSLETTMPTPRVLLSCSVVNEKIYAIGGSNIYQGPGLSTVEVYDPVTNTWDDTTRLPMPTARVCVSTNVVNGKIYAIGGSLGSPQWYQGVTTNEEYDPVTNQWATKAAMHTGRTYFSTSVVNGKIYAFGGKSTSGIHLSSAEEYDPVTDTWTEITNMPTERSGLTSSAVNGKIYTIGGWVGSSTSLSTVEEYDLQKDLARFIDYVNIDKSYAIPGADTVLITARVKYPIGISLLAEFEAPDQIPIDSLQLFDDGNHNDGDAGDSLFANIWITPPTEERNHYVDLIVTRIDSDTIVKHFNNMAIFTTIGPVVVEEHFFVGTDTIPNSGDNIQFKITLRNEGSNATAQNITARISSSDSNITSIPINNFPYGNIQPGQSVMTPLGYSININSNCPPGYDIPILVEISTGDNMFWSDSIFIHTNPTGIEKEDNNLPKTFSLKQNYPNPFNPSTTIEFSLPKTEFVTLKIYNLLGQAIATLVSDKIKAGKYEYEFEAQNLPSGIYYYQLSAGEYREVKKMILLQ